MLNFIMWIFRFLGLPVDEEASKDELQDIAFMIQFVIKILFISLVVLSVLALFLKILWHISVIIFSVVAIGIFIAVCATIAVIADTL